jgi:hypothetical protein
MSNIYEAKMPEVVEVVIRCGRADGVATYWGVRPGSHDELTWCVSDANRAAGHERALADAEFLRRAGFQVTLAAEATGE